jgi:hypothetical protein
MTIFAAMGGVLTPENRLKLSKGEIQMNYLARKAYPEARFISAALDKVMCISCCTSITCDVLLFLLLL